MSELFEDGRREGDPGLSLSFVEEKPAGARIKVVGVGGGGSSAVNRMLRAGVEGVQFVAMNTDLQALDSSVAPVKVQLGGKLTRGLGAGADPEIGRQAAVEDTEKIIEILEGSDMVFLTAGLGGGTGTGGAPIIASLAAELGALTVAVVTKPFRFEGKRRLEQAEQGLLELREHVDTLIIIPNERLLHTIDPKTSMVHAFGMADDILRQAVQGISDLITVPGEINLDFADVRAVMKGMGMAVMGTGVAEGDNRAVEAAQRAISSPLLEEASIDGARGVLINVTGGPDMTLYEISEASRIIQEAASEEANIIFGTVVDERMAGQIKITVIATGFDRRRKPQTETVTSAQQMTLAERERLSRREVEGRPSPEPARGRLEEIRMRELKEEGEEEGSEKPPFYRQRKPLFPRRKEAEEGSVYPSRDEDSLEALDMMVEVDKNNLDVPAFLRRKMD